MPLIFNFAIEYAVRKVQEKPDWSEINETHQLLVCADNVNILEDNMNTTKQNIEAVIDANKKVGLEENAEETKCTRIIMPYHQNVGKNHNLKRQIIGEKRNGKLTGFWWESQE
jgi:hypothetical protein